MFEMKVRITGYTVRDEKCIPPLPPKM